MATVFLFAICATLAGAAKEIAIAYRYGVGEVVDAYQFLFNVSQWPLSVLSSVFTAALVPLVVRLRAEDNRHLSVFRTEVILGSLLVAILMLPLMILVVGAIVDSRLVALPPDVHALAATMVTPMVMAMSCGAVAVALGGWLLAAGRQVNTLLQAIPALAVLTAVLLFAPSAHLIVWSTAVGFLCYAMISWFVLRPEIHWNRASSGISTPYWVALLAGMTTLIGGQVLTSLVTFVDQFFAVRIGVGALSTFGYANRIAAIASTIGALVISRAMLPVLSRMNVEAPDLVIGVTLRYGVAVFTAATVVAVGCASVSEHLVRILYERGQFGPADTTTVAHLVRYAFLPVPFYLTSMVFVSALLAQGRYRGVMYAAALSSAIKLSLAGSLVQWYGLPGLLTATALVYLAATVYCALQVTLGWNSGRRGV
jgi:peptidoglycan biosynthesis protein MviN/MurJ (putative lipid II flippase)